MQRFSSIVTLFKGRHFDGQIIILCVTWYTSFKLSLRDLVIMMADRGIPVTHTTILRWSPVLPAGVREALAALCSSRRWIVEDGRDLYKGSGTMGVPVPRRRQSGPDGRFLLSRNRDVNAAKSFPRSAMKHTRVPTKDYVGRLCGLAWRGAGNAKRRRTSRPRPGSIQSILEQSGSRTIGE
jgi:transposase-like protein